MLLFPYDGKTWLSALGGGAAAFAFFYLLAVLVPDGMGMGDVKLALVMGLFLGAGWVAMALILAFSWAGWSRASCWPPGGSGAGGTFPSARSSPRAA